jgi:hypothetical protein
MTYVACVITITVAAFIRSYVCSTSTNNRTDVPPPRMNEVLTPPACQTLLTYTLILVGSPIRLQNPLCFCSACAIVKSDSIDHFSSILLWVRHGNYYLNGLVWEFLHTLLPMHSEIR